MPQLGNKHLNIFILMYDVPLGQTYMVYLFSTQHNGAHVLNKH